MALNPRIMALNHHYIFTPNRLEGIMALNPRIIIIVIIIIILPPVFTT